ncbi:DUF1949 domain-containing protein [Polaromonas sp.]|uniref:DUF1949 domain-containing protein n=1 Tax=Polaromonas sp. TaxID=1869339 RepID=UPI003BAD20EB
MLQFADESSLRWLCEQQVTVLDAVCAEAVTLVLRMKASQAGEFEEAARNLLRGALHISRVS